MPSVTLSSAGTATILVDYLAARTTTIGVAFVSSTSSSAYTTPQVTLDASAVTGATPVWFSLSTAAAVTFTSSTNFDTPPIFQITTPIAGVRVASSSTSGGIVLRVLQNAGG